MDRIARERTDEFLMIVTDDYYDEIFSARGIRLPYRRALELYRDAKPSIRGARYRAAKRAFDGDAELVPIPRCLRATEAALLRKGVAQRARAIRTLIAAVHSGELSPTVRRSLPAGVLERILARSPEGRVSLPRPDPSFWYSPDIIRDADGIFRVLEDNVGYVGGLGDLDALRVAGAALSGRKPPAPSEFYRRVVRIAQAEAQRKGGGKVVLWSYSPDIRVTQEDERLAHALRGYGVIVETDVRRFRIRDDELFHRGERVGYVIMNIDARDADSRVYGIRGFWRLVAAGKLGCSGTPGIEFSNDKETYGLVTSIIRSVLREEPIFPDLATVSLGKSKDRDSVFGAPGGWVVKRFGGKGGSQVWVLRNLRPSTRAKLQRRVETGPSEFIAQQYVELSRVFEYSVDLRAFAFVSADSLLVADEFWGRATKAGGHGKVNISAGGRLSVIEVCRGDSVSV